MNPLGTNNPLLDQLELLQHLITQGPCKASELQAVHGISAATLKRYIAEVRHLGAEIVSVRLGGSAVYSVVNAAACEPRLSRWLELERARSLV